jgi:spermidine/putrescine transport system permease protein
MKKSNKIFKVIVIFFLVFLYSPALLLPIFSFNNSKVISFPLSGFSTIWFEELLYENTLHNALFNSLLIVGIIAMAFVFFNRKYLRNY